MSFGLSPDRRLSGTEMSSPSSFGASDGRDSFAMLDQEVRDNLRQFMFNVKQMAVMVQQIGSKKDSTAMRERLRETMALTKTLAGDTEKTVKELSEITRGERGTRTKIVEKLRRDFVICLQNFKTQSKLALEKESSCALPTPSRTTSYRGPSSADIGESGSRRPASLSSMGFVQTQDTIDDDLELEAALMRDRDRDIKDIADTVVQVNEMFRDLGEIVADQGEMIDVIENNITVAAEDTEIGVEELVKAEKSQRKARTKKCCILLLVVILSVVAVLIILFATKIIKF